MTSATAVNPIPARAIRSGSKGQPCRSCGARLSHTFVDLGASPLCESFLSVTDLDRMEPNFPLRVMVCSECFLVQLGEYVAPEHIFSDYAYFSSYSTSWVAHAKSYVEMITHRLGLGRSSLVVELASNDGYLLQHFLPKGIPVIGIEPAANVAAAAEKIGVATRIDFFGTRLAREMAAEGISADLIAGNNVLAQVPDLNDFVAGLPFVLAPEGVVTLEFPHLARLIDECQFDTIYHEHFSYFSLVAVDKLVRRHGLRVVDVEELATHGGSLRVYLAHEGSGLDTAPAVGRLLEAERAQGYLSIETYTGFQEAVRSLKRDLLDLLIGLKRDGKTIVGYGAPGKGNTLLNFCGIGPDFLDFTVDRNPYKHGRFTPGMRVPILEPEALDKARPDYVVILPWNLKREIMAQLAHIQEWGGRFIIPIPRPSIIEPSAKEAG